MVYLIKDNGGTISVTRTPYKTLPEAKAQGEHDAANGFGVPLRIEDDKGKTVFTFGE